MVGKLKALAPTSALVYPERDWQRRQPEMLRVELLECGDLVQVLPGARVPTDARVVHGRSTANESLLTGEPMPVLKEPGSRVYGGSLNVESFLVVEVTAIAAESTLAAIASSVKRAQQSRVRAQALADRVARVFVPVILTIAVLTFVVWLLLAMYGVVSTGGNPPFVVALKFAITVLVISCPCAFALAVPTPIAVGTGVAALHGVLVTGGGAVFENACALDAVLFDKTGTLTVGAPRVVAVDLLQQDVLVSTNAGLLTTERLMAIAGAAETGSEHPIGRAIVAHCMERDYALASLPSSFVSMPGAGIQCEVEGHSVLAGTERLLQLHGVALRSRTAPSHFPSDATLIHVAVDGLHVARIALQDVVRPEAPSTLQWLSDRGAQLWLVSGDQVTMNLRYNPHRKGNCSNSAANLRKEATLPADIYLNPNKSRNFHRSS